MMPENKIKLIEMKRIETFVLETIHTVRLLHLPLLQKNDNNRSSADDDDQQNNSHKNTRTSCFF